MATLDELQAMPAEYQADAMLQEFGIPARVQSSIMDAVRNRLIEHLKIAERRGLEERTAVHQMRGVRNNA
jgi:hypothetical protein